MSCEVTRIIGLLPIIRKSIPTLAQRNDISLAQPHSIVTTIKCRIYRLYLLRTETSKRMPLIIKLQICHLDLFLKRCKITTFPEYMQVPHTKICKPCNPTNGYLMSHSPPPLSHLSPYHYPTTTCSYTTLVYLYFHPQNLPLPPLINGARMTKTSKWLITWSLYVYLPLQKTTP